MTQKTCLPVVPVGGRLYCMRFAEYRGRNMGLRACAWILLLVATGSVWAAGESLEDKAGQSVVPWEDMVDKPVLRVEQVADLGALLAVESVLKLKGGGHQVRLLAVGRSEAWFVAGSLPPKGWQELLDGEPRLVPGEQVAGESVGLHAAYVWVPDRVIVPSPEPAH